MTKLSGGEALVKSLLANGVETIFGLPGGQTYHFFDAVQKEGDALALFNARHEQGAAYMAYGYARSTGKVGVYCVVPGPGVLNTTAALATAYGNNTPVLCITGQIPSTAIGRGIGYLHEIPDQLGILQRLTKWAERVPHPSLAPQLVNEAFKRLNSGRPRPVALEMAPDMMELRCDVELVGTVSAPAPLSADPNSSNRAAILSSSTTMIMIGGGVTESAELPGGNCSRRLWSRSGTPGSSMTDISSACPIRGSRLWAGCRRAVLAVGALVC
jgi:acetolactate synthase-1/2/3 large subunit